jgi:Tetratricopeptide repeat
LKEKITQNPKDLDASFPKSSPCSLCLLFRFSLPKMTFDTSRAKYALAVLYSTTNRPEEAINEALGIIKIDKQYNEQGARKFLLQISTSLLHYYLFSFIVNSYLRC